MPTTADYFKLHFIVFLWGFTAILGKLITLPAVEMVFYRTAMAAIGMAILIRFYRGGLRIGKRDVARLLLTGGIVALHWITFFGSARMANVSVSLVGFATASLWTSFLEPLVQKKKIKGYEVGLGLCVIVGIFLIFSFSAAYRAGFLVAILSGFLAALFSVVNAQLVRRINARVITFYEMVGACAVIALFFPFYAAYWTDGAGLRLWSGAYLDFVYLGILALVCTVYAFTVMVNLASRIPVFLIQLTINLEPLYGIILALLIFGETEKMSVNFYAGALIILGAVAIYPLLRRKYDRPHVQRDSIPLQ